MNVRQTTLFPFLIALVTVMAYANSFSGVLVLDDLQAIEANQRVRHILPRGRQEWLNPRGFVDFTFALNYATGGLNPADYHATNLLIHLLAALALYGVVNRTLQLPSLRGIFGGDAARVALICSLVWAVHPLNASAVTYISQRYESMAGLFYLLSLYGLIRAHLSGKPAFWHCATMASCALGVASKEIAMTAPVALLVYDWLFLSVSARDLLRRKWPVYAGCAALTAVVFAFPAMFEFRLGGREGLAYYADRVSLYYALTECRVILDYLGMALWPAGLCLDHGWLMISHPREVLCETVAVLSLLAVTVSALALRVKTSFFGVWFFLVLSPTSSIFPRADCGFEYRMYLPLIAVVAGVCIGAYCLAGKAFERNKILRPLGIAACAFVVLILSYLTHGRNEVYRSEEAVWRDVMAKEPANARAYVNLSYLLLKRGDSAGAIETCVEAVRRLPDYSGINRDYIERSAGNPAFEGFYIQVNHYCRIHGNWGLALRQMGNMDEAAAHFREALRLVPGMISANVNLASLEFAQGKKQEAMDRLRRVLDENPDSAATHETLANACLLAGETPIAVAHYEAALKLRPDNFALKCRLAWLLATHQDDSVRNGGRALSLATEIVEDTRNRSANALDILAAAEAETGDFDNAIKTVEAALALQSNEDMRRRLDSYRNRLPHRDGQPD